MAPIARAWHSDGARLAGTALLISILFWWAGLRGWAQAQYGYLDVDVVGASPFVWILLITAGGVALATGLLPRRSQSVNRIAVVAFLMAATAPAAVNAVAAIGNGISPARWLMAAFSVGQVGVFLAAMLPLSRLLGGPKRRAP